MKMIKIPFLKLKRIMKQERAMSLQPVVQKKQPLYGGQVQNQYRKGNTVKLRLLANSASPSPVLGQALGQYGINIMNFCKTFNDQTKNINQGVLVPIRITIFNQTSYEIEIKTPSTVSLLKNIAEIQKASGAPKKENLPANQFILPQEIYHVALFKRC